jgi:Na+/melibiose symporter-like transporter
VAGIIVAVIALFGLRELSPGLRDQLMVSMRDRALIEARAKGLDIEESLRHPWRQLLKPDIIVSSLAVAIFLLIYYTAVGFGLIYFTTIFGFSVKDANGLGNWNWGFNVIAVITIGFLSDKLRVRKPFMIVGGVGAAVMIVVYLTRAGHHTSYYHLAIILALLSFALGVAYTPWMASFTETVEARNPALTATGLAIWGWIIRVIVFVAFLILPHVVNTVNPLVNYGAAVGAETPLLTQAQSLQTEIGIVSKNATLFEQLQANPTNTTLVAQAATAAGGPAELQKIVANGPAIQKVLTAATAPGDAALFGKGANGQALNAFTYAEAHAPAVIKAAKDSPGQWKDWYWICFGGTIFFILCVPILKGRWSPKAAKQDEERHEAMVQAELAKLHVEG